jgi:hypothetical protein
MKKADIKPNTIYLVEDDNDLTLVQTGDTFEFTTKYDWGSANDRAQRAYVSPDDFTVVVLDNTTQSAVTLEAMEAITQQYEGSYSERRKQEDAQFNKTAGRDYRWRSRVYRLHVKQFVREVDVAVHYAEQAAKVAEETKEKARADARRAWKAAEWDEKIVPIVAAAFSDIPQSFMDSIDEQTQRHIEDTAEGRNLPWNWGVEIDTSNPDAPFGRVGSYDRTTSINVDTATFLAIVHAWKETYGDQTAEEINDTFTPDFPALTPVPQEARR